MNCFFQFTALLFLLVDLKEIKWYNALQFELVVYIMGNKKWYISGLADGLPIGIGYLAVSFAVGISAHNAGINVLLGALMSFFNLTSAGQAAAISLIAVGTTIAEIALTQLIINARYLLMSCSLSQKYDQNMPLIHRFLISFGITDEIFGVCMAKDGMLNPFYNYGIITTTITGWTAGTVLGSVFGSVLPEYIVSALSVALYGMFIAVFVPPARKNAVIAVIVVASMILSYLMSVLPVVSSISQGFRIIIITVAVSAIAALLFPVEQEE